MTSDLLRRVENHEYADLFIRDLGWSAPDHEPISVAVDEFTSIVATNVSSYRGLRVWVCDGFPGSPGEAAVDREIARTSTDRLVIFPGETEQVWRWPVRRNRDRSTTTRLTRHRHRTGTPNPKFVGRIEAIRLPVNEMLDANAVLAKVRQAFDVEAHNETRRASQLMARMYASLDQAYPTSADAAKKDHEISATLARILFLMFGDDTDMWAPDLFRDFINRQARIGVAEVGASLNTLFAYLDTPPGDRTGEPETLDGFPYVNGGIFEERVSLPPVDQDFVSAVLDACAIDWSTISPAIFGSMFQSVRDARTRRELGEHYTSEENILKTLNPLFLDDLRAEVPRAQTLKDERRALDRLWKKLGEVRFLDPACGCGNFIIVAYRELRDLELVIMERLQDLSGVSQLGFDPTDALKVSLDHFFGFEIDEWPARIAETAMFLIDRQCDLKLKERFGEAPQRLPIQTQATIVAGRSALQMDWAEVLSPSADVVIAGNPPFLGISLRSEEQTAELQAAWGSRYHGTLDYVTGWHAKALTYFRDVDGRWAFVTTNSITQGEPVAPLFSAILDEGWKISFAHRTFRWTSEAAGAAAVFCAIVGFARSVATPRLFDYEPGSTEPVEQFGISNITPYLTDGPTVIVVPSTRPLNAQLGEVAYGSKPTDDGCLIVERDDLPDVMADPIAKRFVRRYVGARELLHNGERYCLWLTDMSADDLAASPVLRARVDGVQAFREASDAASTRAAAATPHLFRQLAHPNAPYLCIPAHVSEARPYFLAARFGPEVIASNANFIAPDVDGFVFSIISSAMFITWQRAVGGRLKGDLRFNKLITWNTFPLPHTGVDERKEIIEAGEGVLVARRLQEGVPLADLYGTGMAEPLARAHGRLDRVVDDLFGLDDENVTVLQREDRLFGAYRDLATPLIGAAVRPKRQAKRRS